MQHLAGLEFPDLALRNRTEQNVFIRPNMLCIHGAPCIDPFVEKCHVHLLAPTHLARIPRTCSTASDFTRLRLGSVLRG